jgi:hypothetical protein
MDPFQSLFMNKFDWILNIYFRNNIVEKMSQKKINGYIIHLK